MKYYLHELRTFLIVWLGQAVSTFGTAMTRFALLIWAYEQTGRATTLAMLGFFSFTVYVILIPAAGVWVDRVDRKRIMIAGDCGAGLFTVIFLLLYASGNLQVWHLYVGEALTGAFEAFQHPAYNASISTIVPREQLARASGLRSLSYETTNILAPILAALMLHLIGLEGIMVIDLLTMGFAIGALISIHIPRPADSNDGIRAKGEPFWRDLTFGLRYIASRGGLLGLTIIYMLIYLFACIAYFSILPAMILARSGGDEIVLSHVQSMMGVGGVVGSILITIWGGPKRKIHGVLAFCAASFLCGDMFFALGRTEIVWMMAAFGGAVFIPTVGSSNTAIWQSKVPLDIQGRVLAASFALQQVTRPVGYLLAGPLADQLFEPAMMPGGALTGIFGGLVGTGPGAGMAVIFICTSICGCVSCLGAYLFPALRNVERDLPDYVPSLQAQPAVGD